MTLDIDNDLSLVDGVETLTLTPSLGGSAIAVSGCMREELSFNDLAVGGIFCYTSESRAFRLSASKLVGYEPVEGDKLTDVRSIGYIVQSKTYNVLIRQFRVTCNLCR